MGSLKKMMRKVLGRSPGDPANFRRGSFAVTGITPGDRGSNTGRRQTEDGPPGRRRRGARTPLGPGRDQL